MKRSVQVLAGGLVLAGVIFLMIQEEQLKRFHFGGPKEERQKPAPCGDFQQLVGIPITLVRQFYSGEVQGKVVRRSECFTVGRAKILINYGSDFNGLALAEDSSSSAMITEIQNISSNQHPADLLKILGLASMDDFKKSVAALGLSFDQGVTLLRLKMLTKVPVRHDRALPLKRGYVQTIDLKRALELKKNGALWIDVRSSAEFAKSPNQYSINVPYVMSNSIDQSWYVRAQDFTKVDQFDLNAVTKRTESSIIVSGADVLDVRVIRALSRLNPSKDGRKIYWYREGNAGMKGEIFETPLSFPVSLIDSKTAARLKLQGAVFVETRTTLQGVYEHARIPGSVSALYVGSDRPVYLHQMVKASFLENKEAFPTNLLPGNKSAELVFYGQDQYDWAALKAVVWATEEGWKNIHWLREGLAGWASAGDLDPETYKTEKKN